MREFDNDKPTHMHAQHICMRVAVCLCVCVSKRLSKKLLETFKTSNRTTKIKRIGKKISFVRTFVTRGQGEKARKQ